VRAQIVQQKETYGSTDSNDQKRLSASGINRSENQSRQITDVNMGRYSMSVATPSF
jgi:hypothetical protein